MKEAAWLYEVTFSYNDGSSFSQKPWIVAQSLEGAIQKASRWAKKKTSDRLYISHVTRSGSIEVL